MYYLSTNVFITLHFRCFFSYTVVDAVAIVRELLFLKAEKEQLEEEKKKKKNLKICSFVCSVCIVVLMWRSGKEIVFGT